MSLHIGPASYEIPAHCQVDAEGQSDFIVLKYENGDAKEIIARSSDRFVRFVTREEVDVTFAIGSNAFISVNITHIPMDVDPIDPVPVEVPDDMKPTLTLEDKLKIYLAEMVSERYGSDSAEYDTFEEAMDLDWDEEDEAPLSGFEVKEMIEEFEDGSSSAKESEKKPGSDTKIEDSGDSGETSQEESKSEGKDEENSP